MICVCSSSRCLQYAASSESEPHAASAIAAQPQMTSMKARNMSLLLRFVVRSMRTLCAVLGLSSNPTKRQPALAATRRSALMHPSRTRVATAATGADTHEPRRCFQAATKTFRRSQRGGTPLPRAPATHGRRPVVERRARRRLAPRPRNRATSRMRLDHMTPVDCIPREHRHCDSLVTAWSARGASPVGTPRRRGRPHGEADRGARAERPRHRARVRAAARRLGAGGRTAASRGRDPAAP